MVSKIIADYMKSNKRLVVPRFGAFIRKDTDGTVVFVPFLKKDDGILRQKISEAYGLQSDEAESVIDGYVANIQATVSAGESFEIEGVGRLTTDSDGIWYLTTFPVQPMPPKPSEKTFPKESVSPEIPSVQSIPAPAPVRQPSASSASAVRNAEKAVSPQANAPVEQRPASTTARIPSEPVSSAYGQSRTSPAPMRSDKKPQQAAPVRTSGQANETYRVPPAGSGTSVQNRPSYRSGPVPPQGRRPAMRPPVQERPHQGRTAAPPVKKTKTDGFILIAILAAIAALAVIVFGMIVKHGEPDIRPLLFQTEENTTSVENDVNE